MFLCNKLTTEYCPETLAETQLILMPISLFYKLHHPLLHVPISITTWSVTIVHNVYLADYAA